jgi:hypothetical protein
MSEEWEYFPCAMGEHTAFVFLDVGVANEAISHRTIALRRKALEHGGDYDGWETPVVKGTE